MKQMRFHKGVVCLLITAFLLCCKPYKNPIEFEDTYKISLSMLFHESDRIVVEHTDHKTPWVEEFDIRGEHQLKAFKEMIALAPPSARQWAQMSPCIASIRFCFYTQAKKIAEIYYGCTYLKWPGGPWIGECNLEQQSSIRLKEWLKAKGLMQ